MALGSTQPLTEMSTRSISWGGKGGRCVRLTTLPPTCAIVMKSGNLNFLEPSGPVQASNGTSLYLPFTLSLTSALDVGGWSTPRPSRFTPMADPVPTVQEAGWAPGQIWAGAE